MSRRAERLHKRMLTLFGISKTALYFSDIWELLGGSSGRIYLTLAQMERDSEIVSERAFDGRRKYRKRHLHED